jgi:hypothetical protein
VWACRGEARQSEDGSVAKLIMKAQNDIGVKMSDKLHLQFFFTCVRCGEMICSTGIANNYHYPLWFIKNPIIPADEGYLCNACANGSGQCA